MKSETFVARRALWKRKLISTVKSKLVPVAVAAQTMPAAPDKVTIRLSSGLCAETETTSILTQRVMKLYLNEIQKITSDIPRLVTLLRNVDLLAASDLLQQHFKIDCWINTASNRRS